MDSCSSFVRLDVVIVWQETKIPEHGPYIGVHFEIHSLPRGLIYHQVVEKTEPDGLETPRRLCSPTGLKEQALLEYTLTHTRRSVDKCKTG